MDKKIIIVIKAGKIAGVYANTKELEDVEIEIFEDNYTKHHEAFPTDFQIKEEKEYFEKQQEIDGMIMLY